MKERLKSMKRLVCLQEKIAQFSAIEQAQRLSELNELARESASVVDVLGNGSLAWSVFPDISNRFLANLEDKKRSAADEARKASETASREGRALESLVKRHSALAREDTERRENETRLESMRFGPAASASRKVDWLD
jgi:hypothetical protein